MFWQLERVTAANLLPPTHKEEYKPKWRVPPVKQQIWEWKLTHHLVKRWQKPVTNQTHNPQHTDEPKQSFEKGRANLSVLQSYGNNIWQTANSGRGRIAFQNSRGISRGPTPADEVIGATREYGINVYGVTEPNCVWTDDLVPSVNSSAKEASGCGLYWHHQCQARSGDTSLVEQCNS